MTKLYYSQDGAVNGLLIALIMSVLIGFGALGFGTWAFMSREDYRKNVNKKIDEAVEVAVKKAETRKESEFIQREKKPLTSYSGPQSLGSIKMKYPKTWSLYVDDGDENEITVYGHPKFVPANNGRELPAYALSVQVLDKTYDEAVGDYEKTIQDGQAKAKPYKLPKQPDIVGLKIDGNLDDEHNGSAVIVPLRDKALVVSTLAERFTDDFNKIILKNFNFRP